MENQSNNKSDNLKRDLQLASRLLYINPVWYYSAKTVRFVFEWIAYITSVLMFVGAIWFIPLDPFKTTEKIDESITIMYTYQVKEVSQIMMLLKIVFIVFSVITFCFGLLLRDIRRKNNRIKDAAALVEGVIETT